jgi:NAD(P)-dependent dehydrogenase (short-subunit alcohol dehydrogenase family)
LILLGRAAQDEAVDLALGALAGAGMEAEYWTCDVSQPGDVAAAVDRAVRTYGRIDGLIHGAGVLHDSLIEYMTAADFASVVEVKVGGLAALGRAARPHGLRFVTGLSSLAAVTGNAGQANYTAANRAMAALIRGWSAGDGSVRGQTLWLPPVEGVGMAAGAELRELLERRGLGDAYVDADEAAAAFVQQLFLAPAAYTDAILVRVHPQVRTVRLPARAPGGGSPEAALTPPFDAAAFPMIDSVQRLDAGRGLLAARRTFTVGRDLWLPDHRPLKGLAHPIVSAIMLVETALEAARLLYPHLDAVEVEDVDFLEMLACDPAAGLPIDLVCRRLRDQAGVVCDVSVARLEDPAQPPRLAHPFRSFGCRVKLGVGSESTAAGGPWLTPEACDTAPKDRRAMMARYESHTALAGRYLVTDRCDGTADGLVAGYTTYTESTDFSGRGANGYQYSPYVLEALLQIAHFYHHMRDEDDARMALPMRIGRLRLARRAVEGERLRVEGRRTSVLDGGTAWDVRAVDDSGMVVMAATDLFVRWYGA